VGRVRRARGDNASEEAGERAGAVGQRGTREREGLRERERVVREREEPARGLQEPVGGEGERGVWEPVREELRERLERREREREEVAREGLRAVAA
jgi:hypothetical protein